MSFHGWAHWPLPDRDEDAQGPLGSEPPNQKVQSQFLAPDYKLQWSYTVSINDSPAVADLKAVVWGAELRWGGTRVQDMKPSKGKEDYLVQPVEIEAQRF